MRYAFLALLAAHGMAHLPGFLVPWRLLSSPELPFKTSLLWGWVRGDPHPGGPSDDECRCHALAPRDRGPKRAADGLDAHAGGHVHLCQRSPGVPGFLPAPVAGYFQHVLQTEIPVAEMVTITQQGEFRMSEAEDSWRPFTATQQFTLGRPGFAWDARIAAAPLMPRG